MIRTFFCVALLFVVSGCALWSDFFGPAETPEQRAYRLAGEYVYLQIPVATYAADPNAKEPVLDAIEGLDKSVFDAMTIARASLESGGDATEAALAAAGSALASYSLQMTGAAVLPDDPIELAGRAAVLSSVALRSAAQMRAWRKTYLKRKLADMVLNKRAPTESEWAEVDAKIREFRAIVRRE